MQLSPDTEAALDFLASKHGELRKRNDMGTLLEIGAMQSLFEEVNEIVMAGKNTWSCYSILKKMSANDEGYKRLEHEFMTNVNTVRGYLSVFCEKLPEVEKERFETVYLGMNQGTVRNLVDLAHDLSALKNAQNSTKYDEN